MERLDFFGFTFGFQEERLDFFLFFWLHLWLVGNLERKSTAV